MPAQAFLLSYCRRGSYAQIMTKSKSLPKPRVSNQLASLITDMETGEIADRLITEDGRDLAAVMLGRRGGLKGGLARRNALSPARRSEIAKKAAAVRWSKK